MPKILAILVLIFFSLDSIEFEKRSLLIFGFFIFSQNIKTTLKNILQEIWFQDWDSFFLSLKVSFDQKSLILKNLSSILEGNLLTRKHLRTWWLSIVKKNVAGYSGYTFFFCSKFTDDFYTIITTRSKWTLKLLWWTLSCYYSYRSFSARRTVISCS